MSLRDDMRRARAFSRRHPPLDPEAPVAPPLPEGTLVAVPERGEMFVRRLPGPEGALPVLLLHGWTASADLNWFLVYGVFEDRHPMIAVDHRGHGRGIRAETPFTLEDCADDAAGLLRALGIDKAIVVGYSMGGPIALHLAHRHPDLVAGIVCAATALEWRASWRDRVIWRFMGLFEAGLRAGTGQGVLRRALRVAIDEQPDLAPWRAWLGGEFRRGDPADMAAAGRALGLYDARPFASRLGIPAAVVLTTRDRMVKPRKQRALASALRAEVFELHGDHDAPLVMGDELAKVTLRAVEAVVRPSIPADGY
jgi:pimeloyl-ACP methyl ester carboxylesterase